MRNRGAYEKDTGKNRLITKRSNTGTALRDPANHSGNHKISAEANNSLRRLLVSTITWATFMRADADLIEGTVILAAAVVVALAHVALDCVVGLFVCKAHTKLPPFLRYGLSMCANGLFMLENFLSAATAEPASTSSETSAASAKAAAAAAAGSGASAETAGSGARPRAGAVVVMMVREQ